MSIAEEGGRIDHVIHLGVGLHGLKVDLSQGSQVQAETLAKLVHQVLLIGLDLL